MAKSKLWIACVLSGMMPLCTSAQQSARFRPETEFIFRAEDQFAQKLFALAAQNADAALKTQASCIASTGINENARAHFIKITGALKTDAPHAIDSALAFLPKLVSKPLRDRLSLSIARYYFLHSQLADAIPYYESAGIANLDNAEIADAKFELAYAYFNNRNFATASTLFSVMKEVPGKYYNPGNYYYGLLAYNEGNFEAALTSFERIQSDPVYKPVVPYYIAEIYYFMGKRDKALSEALRLIKEKDKLYYDNELHLLAAQCLFEAGRYGEALPYFEHFYKNSDRIRKEDLYEMGYAYYRVDEWKNAIDKFKPLSATRDSLGQTAMYLLGDCYLKSGDKEQARSAFGICSKMPFHDGQREASLLLHGKLSYELAYLDEATQSVKTLLQDYPFGTEAPKARLLLSQIYLHTNNFEEAYKSLSQNLKINSKDFAPVRQRAAFGYAMQEIQNHHLNAAYELLGEALSENAEPSFTQAALFWKAELSYRAHRYDDVVASTERFLSSTSRENLAASVSAAATRENAYLNLGYASMALKDYKKAQQAFTTAKTAGSNTVAQNASLREADALFMQKNFSAAAPLYAAIAQGKGADASYAQMQSAIIAGLRGDQLGKIKMLQSVLSDDPNSALAAEARYETGLAFIAASNYDEAIKTLEPLAKGKSAGVFAPKALLKIGTVRQQQAQDDKALAAYLSIIRDWSDAPERSDAIAAVKTIFISRNQPEAYDKLLAEYNLPQASEEEMQIAYYNAAESQYASSNWREAQIGFERFLAKYDDGALAVKARYYLANSYYNLKNQRAARLQYDTLLQGEWGNFSDESVKRAAGLAFGESDYNVALNYYRLMAEHASSGAARTEAYTGLMRSSAKLNNELQASLYADTLLKMENLAPMVRDEANLYQLRKKFQAGALKETDTLLKALQESADPSVAAEARYYKALQLFNSGKLKEAETAAGNNIKKSAGNEYWLIKSYLLLGDIFIRQKDYFNARATLQSVAQRAGIPELAAEARKKLEEIKASEGSKLSNE